MRLNAAPLALTSSSTFLIFPSLWKKMKMPNYCIASSWQCRIQSMRPLPKTLLRIPSTLFCILEFLPLLVPLTEMPHGSPGVSSCWLPLTCFDYSCCLVVFHWLASAGASVLAASWLASDGLLRKRKQMAPFSNVCHFFSPLSSFSHINPAFAFVRWNWSVSDFFCIHVEMCVASFLHMSLNQTAW